MADQKAMKKRLKALMILPENQICSDCNERQPRWASLIVPPPGAPPDSLPIGAFCCLECSGSHRRLGVHISFVRSINLDSWKEKEVLGMENGGNAKVNAIFEARLSGPGIKPTNHANGPTRERFIRDKYERRKYYDAAGFTEYASHQRPPPVPAAQPEAASVGPPSDAARQRLEQRRTRINKAQSSVADDGPTSSRSSKTRIKPAVAQAPVSAPPPSMDLLDLMGGGGTSAPSAPAVAPVDDLFASFVVAENPPQSVPAATAAPKPAQLDIMSLYNSSAHPQQPQMMPMSNGFAAFNVLGSGPNQNGGGTGAVMPQQSNISNMMYNNSNMQPMPNMMANMQFVPQQQQQAPNMMYGQGGAGSGYNQQQMMMMMQQQQQMMMMQQQQQHQSTPQRMMQHQNGFGGGAGGADGARMGGHPSMIHPSPQNQQQQQPGKEDPFAQFGVNAFRS